MKFKLFSILLAVVAALGAAVYSVGFAGGDDSAQVENSEFATPDTYRYTWPTDTITTSERDTLEYPRSTLLLSAFQYQYGAYGTSLSGTYNCYLYLYESNSATGNNDWRLIDSATTATAAARVIRGTTLYGQRHRLVIGGRNTQSSKYTVNVVLKPTAK